ncbi:alpha/beta hydrolase [Kovacikia minuta CCNUW1]|uniref:alpha/beta fold hydrolase n=1 Tax=Kovacikia minuta TaxID=2931930 RepID=UPI001CCCD80A|nr:alpha/beta hydrolase [Kovacikia minuta]UBF25172.1 alpha/beta hydrolase [Kovacikia minuta CCNUW1]
MPIIDILGVPHAYELTEPTHSREVLVFIHGWLLSRSYWQPLIELLSSDFQCLSYDLRGFGASQLTQQVNLQQMSADYSLAAYARDLGILLKSLNLSHVWLVGHSLGGSIALWGADHLPELIQGVICINAGGGIYLKEEFERFRSVGQRLVKFRPRWLCYVPLLDLLFTRASVAKAIAPRWGRQRLIDFVVAHPEAALGTLLDSTTEVEVHLLPQIVARLKQPVYFIAGSQDPIMEPQYVNHLASFHPLFQGCGANVMEIPNCGHLAMVEQTDVVAAQIRTILARK